MRLEFLIIDFQNDFCLPDGALPVPGAMDDADRLAETILRLKDKISMIHATLDTHHFVDISHPIWYIDAEGNHPEPITTVMTAKALKSGIWTTTNPLSLQRTIEYEEKLEKNGRYPHVIWPPHCLIGESGMNVVEPVRRAFRVWEITKCRSINYVTKGSNPWTEHYSGVIADVPDDEDETTQLNTPLIETLARADIIGFSGQALNFCVANTGKDVADKIGEDNIKKITLLEDTCSNVPGYENLATEFLKYMKDKGMKTCKS